MPRSGKRVSPNRLIAVLLLGIATCFAPAIARAATDSAAVTGIVKDSQGVVQLGALVQVITEHAVTVATAFTDQHGR